MSRRTTRTVKLVGFTIEKRQPSWKHPKDWGERRRKKIKTAKASRRRNRK